VTNLRFELVDPQKGYVTNNLLVPKGVVNQTAVKNALTFHVGEEVVEDSQGGAKIRPKKRPLWSETAHHLVVPRAFMSKETRRALGCPWVQRQLSLEFVDVEDTITSRDSQEKALQAMRTHRGGTVNLACGKGKTVVALKYWAQRKVPCLVVVNSAALVHQWIEEVHRHVGKIPVGVIQAGKHSEEAYPITIATVQTLANRKYRYSMDFRRRFGIIFYDETHHMSAPHFVEVADMFFGERFGLTATATRTDGLESIYQYHLGPVIVQDLTQELVPETIFHRFQWTLTNIQDGEDTNGCRSSDGLVSHGKLCRMLGQVQWRNEIILDKLKKDLAEGRTVLVLTHSVDHSRSLFQFCDIEGAGLINGEDTKAFDRVRILKECNPVFGTFQLAREALDKPSLDTMHVCTPFGNSNDMQQSWGRIQRKREDKLTPLVRVYEDQMQRPSDCEIPSGKMVTTSTRQCDRLRKYLKVLGYPFKKKKRVKIDVQEGH